MATGVYSKGGHGEFLLKKGIEGYPLRILESDRDSKFN
jgi:hypothetical protein